jgi:hypothetical protein
VAIRAFDILYVPSHDVAADLAFYRDVLGSRAMFAIEAMGTRVAEVALAREGRPPDSRQFRRIRTVRDADPVWPSRSVADTRS